MVPVAPTRTLLEQMNVTATARSATHAGGARKLRPGSAGLRVAVLDTDSGFVKALIRRLDSCGWAHRVAPDTIPLDELVAMRLHALVLDPAILGPPGWTYLEWVCAELPGLAVIVCTGPSSVAQRVRGLRLGADDWLSKPCHPEELIARVEAVVRRSRAGAAATETPAPTVTIGELELLPGRFQASVAGRPIELTRREFELLELLAGSPDRVLERDEIYRRVWGYEMAHGDRSVDVFVRKLRSKLEHVSPGWRYVHTHFGIGYRFAPELVAGRDPQIGEMQATSARAADAPPAR